MEREGRSGHPVSPVLRTIAVIVVCVAALAALAATHGANDASPATSASSASSPTPRLSITPRFISTFDTAQLACPSGAALSPDGASAAVIGPTGSCEVADAQQGRPLAHRLVIFDMSDGRVKSTILLDPLVLTDGLPAPAAEAVRALRYAGLGWSPDGSAYAVAYVAFDRAGSFSLADTLGSGLLLVGPTGAQARVIRGDAGFFAAATASYAGLPVWNLKDGTVTAPIAAPPSLAYAWKGAVPTAILPLGQHALSTLPVDAGPRYPVGNPSGDATFTIWQPGMLLGLEVAPSGAAQAGADGAFVTSFTTWSPDATSVTELVAGVAVPWLLTDDASAAPVDPAPIIQAPATLTETPARDPAMKALEREVGAAGWALIAWNLDGSLLASIDCTAAGATTLELRDTASGAVVGRAPLQLGASDPGCRATSYGESLGAYANPNLRLLWSPDGSRILVSDQAGNRLEIWDVLRG